VGGGGAQGRWPDWLTYAASCVDDSGLAHLAGLPIRSGPGAKYFRVIDATVEPSYVGESIAPLVDSTGETTFHFANRQILASPRAIKFPSGQGPRPRSVVVGLRPSGPAGATPCCYGRVKASRARDSSSVRDAPRRSQEQRRGDAENGRTRVASANLRHIDHKGSNAIGPITATGNREMSVATEQADGERKAPQER
jgi:hypothetical protein